jgi:hypothetical protein
MVGSCLETSYPPPRGPSAQAGWLDPGWQHTALMTGLQPGSAYVYAVGDTQVRVTYRHAHTLPPVASGYVGETVAAPGDEGVSAVVFVSLGALWRRQAGGWSRAASFVTPPQLVPSGTTAPGGGAVRLFAFADMGQGEVRTGAGAVRMLATKKQSAFAAAFRVGTGVGLGPPHNALLPPPLPFWQVDGSLAGSQMQPSLNTTARMAADAAAARADPKRRPPYSLALHVGDISYARYDTPLYDITDACCTHTWRPPLRGTCPCPCLSPLRQTSSWHLSSPCSSLPPSLPIHLSGFASSWDNFFAQVAPLAAHMPVGGGGGGGGATGWVGIAHCRT